MLSPSAKNAWRENFVWFSAENIKDEKNIDPTVLKMLQELLLDVIQKFATPPLEQLQQSLDTLKRNLEALKEKL